MSCCHSQNCKDCVDSLSHTFVLMALITLAILLFFAYFPAPPARDYRNPVDSAKTETLERELAKRYAKQARQDELEDTIKAIQSAKGGVK